MTRVYWHMGQALLPEHFYAQEESLRAESALRFSLLSTPSWGLGHLEWDKFLLPTGVLSIREISLIFESGVVLDIPGNASPRVLDLVGAGQSRVPIFVQLQSDFVKVQSGPEIVQTRPGEPGEEGIQRVLQKVSLSVSQAAAEHSFKLAEVQSGADGVWEFCEDYVPPLLRAAPGLLFDAQLRRMEDVVNLLGQSLKQELQDNHLSGETHVLAKQAVRSMFNFKATLLDLKHGIAPHPYDLFCALRSLYVDLCVLRNVQELEAIEEPYDHRELAACFGRVLVPLERFLARGRPEVPYSEFSRKEGLLFCDIDKNIKRAKDAFLLVQKPSLNTKLDLSRVKLASPSRLHVVHERSLTGVAFTRSERPPFAQSLSSTVEIYSLGRGQEWDFVVAEGRLVLFDGPALDGCRLYLYSRVE
jgi:type VI secretion system protein ImpJ